jgi:phospholipase/carboxylesterase
MAITNDYTKKPLSGGDPKQIVVLLHGYGSNGRDLISLAPYWQQKLPDAVFVSPDAPFPCEMMVDGGFQWFSLQDYTPVTLLQGAEEAHPHLDNYLDSLVDKYGITDENLALAGFSQGTMMSLFTGPRRKNRIAGILGYSGALVGGGGLKAAQKPPVHLIHGEDDSVVPLAAYHHARDILEKTRFEISGYTTPRLAHSIDEKGIESGGDFLARIFK